MGFFGPPWEEKKSEKFTWNLCLRAKNSLHKRINFGPARTSMGCELHAPTLNAPRNPHFQHVPIPAYMHIIDA